MHRRGGNIVTVTGDRELIKKLGTIDKAAKAAIRTGTRAGCKIIANQVKATAPQGSTGDMRRNVKVRAMPRSKKYIGCMVQLAIPYGAFVDLGTKNIKANPFMQNAAKDQGQAAADTALEIIKEAIGG